MKTKTQRPKCRANLKQEKNITVLAIDPSSTGFGYSVLLSPNKLIDWGVVSTRINRLNCTVRRFQWLVEEYKPTVIVVERPNYSVGESALAKKFVAVMSKYTAVYELPFSVIKREQVDTLFKNFDAHTKYAIAEKVIEFLPQLAPFKPQKKEFYENEDSNMKIFDAVALALTFYEDLDAVQLKR